MPLRDFAELLELATEEWRWISLGEVPLAGRAADLARQQQTQSFRYLGCHSLPIQLNIFSTRTSSKYRGRSAVASM